MKIFFVLLFLLAFCASAQEAGEDSSVIKIKQKNLLLTVVSWPFVHIVQPSVEFLMYPFIPPLIYVSRENLIDKSQNLITFGKNRQIMFCPFITPEIGDEATIGFVYKHSDLFLDNDNVYLLTYFFVNTNWNVTLRYRKRKIYGSSFYWGLYSNYRIYGNDSFRDTYSFKDSTVIYSFANNSVILNPYGGFGIAKNWNLEFEMSLDFYRFALPSLTDSIYRGESVSDRGFYRNYEVYPLTVSLLHNSLDEPYVATRGRKFSLSYTYAPVTRYNGTKNHNYHIVESRVVNYLLLGSKSYAMTVAESNANREKFKNLTFAEAIEMLNPINIKEEILDRRVLVTQIKARYMLEENEGKAPFTAMSRLGGNFPLRAYRYGYFNAPLVTGISAEYRWPIERYTDMVIFNEYGIYGKDFSQLSISNVKNSYGFGFRVRTPRSFVTRFTMAFHGLQGINVILSLRPEYP